MMRIFLSLLAVAGMVISTLALRVHYSTETEPCSINARWDCGIVNHSPYAEIRHVPVAAVGIAGYLLLGALALLRQRFVLLLATMTGFCFALRLSFIEELVLQVWCLYCVISQGIIALLLLASVGWLAAEYWRLRRRENERAV